ncbi:solanesyl diphosphate synthase, partial [Candidatus Poribacteria bacterium]|nr:solanesyl diphosphate synthase [Candidatus Poribacteria bacterium]
ANADADDLAAATAMLRDLGGIEYTAKLAKSYVESAMAHLNAIPPSRYRDLLGFWADYMVNREF